MGIAPAGRSAVLRYQLRVIGFAAMLTSAYPAELFGDTGAPAPQAYGTQPGYGVPQGYIAGPAAGRQWLLILSAPARKLMVFFIVFGVVVLAVVSYLDAAASGSAGRLQGISMPSQAADRVGTDLGSLGTALTS